VDRLTGSLIIVVVFLEPGLVALWIAAGSAKQRRSHFWLRVVLASATVPAFMAGLLAIARLNLLPDEVAKPSLSLLFFLGVMALMFVPGLLYRTPGSSPGPSEDDGGGGPGAGPPPSSPDAPRGGIPLPDADLASARTRDHAAPKFDPLTERRPAHRPVRSPARRRSPRRHA
jgi:hypothetical protein